MDDSPPPSSSVESVELVRLAQAGERDALDRLLDRYQDRVRRIVRARLGPELRRRVESVDILQETFAAAVKDFDRFEVRDEGSLVHWLGRIAHLRVLEAARKHGSGAPAQETPLAADSERLEVGIPADGAPSPSAELARREQEHLLERCLDALGEEKRELILMRDFAGASWQAVADATGKPSAAAARMAHARAMAELSGAMARYA